MAGESLTFDIFWRDHGTDTGFRALSKAAKDAAGNIGDVAGKLDKVSGRVAKASIDLKGDKEASAQLDLLTAKLVRLGRILAKPGIKPEGVARTLAEISAVSVAMDKLDKTTAKPKVEFGGKGVLGGLQKLIGTGAAALSGGGKAGATGGLGAVAGLPALAGIPAIAIAPAAAAAFVALAALTPAIVGAGVALASFAGFAALARPTITNLTTSLSTLSTATGAYQQASANLNIAIHKSPADLKAYQATIHGLEPDLQNAAKLLTNQHVVWQNLSPSMQKSVVALSDNSAAYKALLPDQKTALQALLAQKAAWDALSPAQQGIAKQMQALGGQFTKLQAAIAPYVLKAFATGLRIVRDLFPAFRPLLVAAGKALDAFLGKMAAWLESPSGKKFINWLETTGPKDIANFGKALWTIVTIFGRVVDFMYNSGQRIIQHFKDVLRFFTQVVPATLQIVNDKIMIIWDRLVISALKHVLGIISAFAALPGPLGAPFRRAEGDIEKTLRQMQLKVLQTVNNMNASFQRLHGKTVTVLVAGSGTWRALSASGNLANATAAAGGKHPGAAAGMLVSGGIPGRDSVLVNAMPGELIVPTSLVQAGAVDHLRGMVPGFATGGIVPSYRGRPAGLGPWAAHNTDVTEQGIISAIGAQWARQWKALAAAAAAAFLDTGARSGNAALAQSFAASILPRGWSFPALLSLWNQESGWNAYAVNPSSGAYGIPQSLGHGHPYNLGDYKAQIVWGLNYIAGRYGTSQAAWAHEQAFNWYDQGGWLPRGVSIAVNRTGRPERILSPHQSGAAPRAVLELRAGHSQYGQFLLNEIRRLVRDQGGGDVQVAFGGS